MKASEFERIIIKSLFVDESLRNKVLPELKTDWFFEIDNRLIVSSILDFNAKFGQMPNALEMKRLLADDTVLTAFENCMSIKDEEVQTPFLLQEIEEFVRKKLMYNVANDVNKFVTGTVASPNGSYADAMADAETFTFNTDIGFDFFTDPDRLYEDANIREKIYNSGIKTINDLIGGGFHEKSLNLFMAPTNIGKTLIMCSLAKNFVMEGLNVLYVTFEDPENKIASRIAQNMFDVTQLQYKHMSRDDFNRVYQKTMGLLKNQNKLIIKEFPEGTVNAMQLESLLKELDDKKGFRPDVLVIDYIGCMIPNGRPNPNLNTNSTLQLISMQVRAVAMEYGIPIISGLQANRGGYGVAEIGLNDVADSFASTTKADAIFGVTQPDEYKESSMYCVKLLKTRYGNQRNDTVLLGVDIEKQRIFDVNQVDAKMSSVNIFDSKPSKSNVDDEPYVYEEPSSGSFDEIDFE